MNNITSGGFGVASSAARAAVIVAGTRPRGAVSAQLLADGSGSLAACTAMLPGDVVVKRPQTQLQNPFMTHGAAINGAKLGPHRAWDPV